MIKGNLKYDPWMRYVLHLCMQAINVSEETYVIFQFRQM